MKITQFILLLTILFIIGCTSNPKIEYQNVYVKPDIKGLQENCSTSNLQKPVTPDELVKMKNDETRFYYVARLYTQALGVYAKCINETKGIVTYVNEIDNKEEEVSNRRIKKPP